MRKSLVSVAAVSLLAVVAGSPLGAAATDESFVLLEGDWETFAGAVSSGSFAWAGEDESFASGSGALGDFSHDPTEADPALLTAIPAPEPPALVLAGLAFGGVLCGRSLVMKRRQAAGGPDDGETDPPRA